MKLDQATLLNVSSIVYSNELEYFAAIFMLGPP